MTGRPRPEPVPPAGGDPPGADLVPPAPGGPARPGWDDVAGFYAETSVPPLLRRLLVATRDLLGTVAGSISVVDADDGWYTKVAEVGVPCRLGNGFPLDEGVTGRAYAQRRPLVVEEYAALGTGHLPPDHPTARGAALAVPLWWRGEIIGVNVAFAGRARRLAAHEVDDVEQLTQAAVPALVRAAASDPLLHRLLQREPVTAGGPVSAPRCVTAAVPALPDCPLTRREQQVLALLTAGLSDREVAAHLVISPRTVHKHVAAVLRKTGTTSRTAAVVHGLERGWLPTGPAGREMGSPAHTRSPAPDLEWQDPAQQPPRARPSKRRYPCPSSP